MSVTPFMKQLLLPLLFLATTVLASGSDSRWVERLAFWTGGTLRDLDERMAGVDKTLNTLPQLALVNSSVRVGLKTGYTTDEDIRWLEVTLKEPALVDTIVMVPPLARAATAVVSGYGFPVRFLLEVTDDKGLAHAIMDHTTADFPNPGCYPVIARLPPQPIKSVRLTATEPWAADGPDVLAMAELLIMSGKRNLAIEGRVSSSSTRNAPRVWTRANLVDMITPLGLPVEPQGAGALGYHSAVAGRPDDVKTITLALPESVLLEEVRLVPVRRKDVPLWFDYGFPSVYKVECATDSTFRDAKLLYEVTDRQQPAPGMNLVCIPVNRSPARYIRVTAQRLWEGRDSFVFALAELQAFAHGENVAPRGTCTASDVLTGDKRWSLAALTDGVTGEGALLELPDWFARLEQRKKLESDRAQLSAERTAVVESAQHTLVYGSVGSVGGITLVSMLLLWRQHLARRRDAQRLQDKLARDLHDEIGSNLGSITLICSMAAQPDSTLESLRADMADIGRVASESADSMRDMVQLISPRNRQGGGRDWLGVLQTLTERLLRGLELDCALPSAPLNWEPDIETRRELYLFCKEVLHNISRHAQALRVSFRLSPTAEGLQVQIADNGIGFDTAQVSAGHGLGNLRERAAAMKGRLQMQSRPGQGTLIHLDLPRTARWSAR